MFHFSSCSPLYENHFLKAILLRQNKADSEEAELRSQAIRIGGGDFRKDQREGHVTLPYLL